MGEDGNRRQEGGRRSAEGAQRQDEQELIGAQPARRHADGLSNGEEDEGQQQGAGRELRANGAEKREEREG